MRGTDTPRDRREATTSSGVEEAGVVPAASWRRSARKKIPDPCVNNCVIRGEEDVADDVDSCTLHALLVAAMGGDAMAALACGTSGLSSISDYPEPRDHHEALANPDAVQW